MLFCKKSSKLIRIFEKKTTHNIHNSGEYPSIWIQKIYVENYIQNMGNASYYTTASSPRQACHLTPRSAITPRQSGLLTQVVGHFKVANNFLCYLPKPVSATPLAGPRSLGSQQHSTFILWRLAAGGLQGLATASLATL